MAEVMVLFLTLCLQLLALPVYVLSYLGLWEPFCKKFFFPFSMEKFAVIYNWRMSRQKQELFRNMMEFADPSGKLTVLEIGCGAGTNFQFFPPNCKVICTDPNPRFRQSLTKRMAQNQHLQFDQFIVASGEDLSQVADASVDVVVSTLVLCSVKNVEGVLKEVCRVLKSLKNVQAWSAEPSGHGMEELWQTALAPRINKSLLRVPLWGSMVGHSSPPDAFLLPKEEAKNQEQRVELIFSWNMSLLIVQAGPTSGSKSGLQHGNLYLMAARQ
ncbi:putative methyltransferase-like protein 7A isoform X1 [Eublepharis macularius]|uniref:Methyltransferase-like protein 7A isoform X1 n=1 Tax=Eublepharis macularius TaxID=481883 RepID=A0AA97J4Y7_EUBMA|nr:putative methyltransferase-like protein 7A isoform X1 [Eublepharis macularius]